MLRSSGYRVATFGNIHARHDRAARGDDSRARRRTRPRHGRRGGQAATFAAWAASLGAEARCIAKRGDDAAGELVRAARGARRRAGRPGRRGRDGRRRLDRRAASARWPSTAGSRRASRRGLIPLARLRRAPPLRLHAAARADGGAALDAARLAREAGARVSVDVAAWTEIRRYGPVRFRELLDELAPDVLFATEAEWELLGGAYLTAPTGVLKRGARGCTVPDRGREARFHARRGRGGGHDIVGGGHHRGRRRARGGLPDRAGSAAGGRLARGRRRGGGSRPRPAAWRK